jgi:hypothetical protein
MLTGGFEHPFTSLRRDAPLGYISVYIACVASVGVAPGTSLGSAVWDCSACNQRTLNLLTLYDTLAMRGPSIRIPSLCYTPLYRSLTSFSNMK